MPGPTTASTSSNFVVPQFDEQVFLMYDLCFFSKLHFEHHTKFHQPYTKVRMLKGQNSALINTLLNKDYPRKEPLLNLTQAKISQLVPSIKLYKQYYNPGSLDLQKEVEFVFPNYEIEPNILGGGRSGYGLVSFDIESQGTTFYTADKQFTAKIKLFFQTFDEITKIRVGNIIGTTATEQYSFLDLIVQPFPDYDIANAELRDKSITSDLSQFRIRADIGWAVPSTSTLNAGEREAVRLTRTSFFLYLTDHDIEINQDGTVNLNISYIGAFDFINRDVRAGIILNKKNKEIYDNLTKAVKEASKPVPNTGEVDNSVLEAKRGDLNLFISNVGPESYQEILEELISPSEPDKDGLYRSKIYQTAISPGVKEQFCFLAGGDINRTNWEALQRTRLGTAPTSSAAATSLYQQLIKSPSYNPNPISFCDGSSLFKPLNYSSTSLGSKENPARFYYEPLRQSNDASLNQDQFIQEPILVDSNGNEYTNISWFYLGDILEVLMKRAYDQTVSETDEKLLLTRFGADFSKRVKLILSDVRYKSVCSEYNNRVNLAHIPISIKKFQLFFYKRVITNRNLHYTMDDFIRDFINIFIKDVFLDRNFQNNRVFKQNINLKYFNIAAMARSNSDPLPTDATYEDVVLVKNIDEKNFLLSSDIEGKPANYYYYLMVFQDTYDPTTLKGNFDEDKERGIPHIYTGRDRGIVKRASFKKTALPYKREERIAGTNKDYNPIVQLSSLYNVDLETFGNTIFMVGSYFYLVPSGMGSTSLGMPNEERSISNIMGLGGYYFVNKITWSLESGKFNSNIVAIHQATGARATLPNGQSLVYGITVPCTDPRP